VRLEGLRKRDARTDQESPFDRCRRVAEEEQEQRREPQPDRQTLRFAPYSLQRNETEQHEQHEPGDAEAQQPGQRKLPILRDRRIGGHDCTLERCPDARRRARARPSAQNPSDQTTSAPAKRSMDTAEGRTCEGSSAARSTPAANTNAPSGRKIRRG